MYFEKDSTWAWVGGRGRYVVGLYVVGLYVVGLYGGWRCWVANEPIAGVGLRRSAAVGATMLRFNYFQHMYIYIYIYISNLPFVLLWSKSTQPIHN